MLYLITFDYDDLNKFTVKDFNENYVTEGTIEQGEDWNHQLAAQAYLKGLPSNATLIHIEDEGTFSINELRQISKIAG